MVKQEYVPQRGDFVRLDFSPQIGHEQAGLRPAIVLSDSTYNAKSGLMIVCPITKHSKGYPFEVKVEKGQVVHGVVLSDHIKNVDWRGRSSKFLGKANDILVAQVSSNLGLLLGCDV